MGTKMDWKYTNKYLNYLLKINLFNPFRNHGCDPYVVQPLPFLPISGFLSPVPRTPATPPPSWFYCLGNASAPPSRSTSHSPGSTLHLWNSKLLPCMIYVRVLRKSFVSQLAAFSYKYASSFAPLCYTRFFNCWVITSSQPPLSKLKATHGYSIMKSSF